MAGAIRSLVNVIDLQLEGLLVPVLLYVSKTMIWREKERSRIRTVQMDNLRGLLGIKRMDSVLNAQIREFGKVVKGVYEMIDENVFHWLGHIERREIDC